MTEINDEEFIHAIFGQICSSRPMQDRLMEDFGISEINKDKDIIILSKINPIFITNEIDTRKLSLKNKKKKNNRSLKKNNIR